MTHETSPVKVYIGNLSYDTSVETLRSEFIIFGSLVELAKIPTKNYGFVKFSSMEEAESAVKELNGKKVDGRNIKVEISKPAQDKSQGRRNFTRRPR
ncbi:MAG: RNA-binding protein [Candidatus Muirbacterium halophilum]|nr:RNA-binding protein [Candidatus Muirbacterium halophilum]MCK9474307.1 RNA-binding protein [Candidatus Muirbacterium halophilum]